MWKAICLIFLFGGPCTYMGSWYIDSICTWQQNEATNLPSAEVSWVGSSSLVIHMKLTRADDQVDVLKVTWKEGKPGDAILGSCWSARVTDRGSPKGSFRSEPARYYKTMHVDKLWQHDLTVDFGFVGALQHLILWQNTHVTSKIKISIFPRKVHIHVYMKQAS